MSDVTQAPNAQEQNPNQPPPDQRDLEIARLTKDLEAAHRRVDELARAIQAGDRDREAFKTRLQREREQLLDVERGNVARTLLEAIDDLDLCLTNSDQSPLAKGVRLIRDGLIKKAEETGLERVELVGRPYDPNLAEATAMDLTADPAEDGKVLEVVKACYQLKGKVIRPGRVKVARYVKPADA
jgi:molecular chaperone GrpE